MKKLFISAMLLLIAFTAAADEGTTYYSDAPWGEVEIYVTPEIQERFEIQGYADMKAVDTAIHIKFISRKIYTKEDAGRKDIFELMKKDRCHPYVLKDHIRSAIIDTNGIFYALDKNEFIQHIQGQPPVELPDFHWRPVTTGVFAIQNRLIKALIIWWEPSKGEK